MDHHPRKRMRLSSPTFDDQVQELSQEDIDAFDSVDAQLSQDPFHAQTEPDYSNWFASNASTSFAGFSAATAAMPGFQRPCVASEDTTSLFVPSVAALHEAEEKMKKWQEELDLDPSQKPHISPHPASPPRPMFSSARNAFSSVHPPETPTPVQVRSANVEPTPTKPHSASHGPKRQTKPFKSPLISVTPSVGQLPTPNPPPSTPQATIIPSPLRPSSIANCVMTQKPLGFTSMHVSAPKRPKFVTPFKAVPKSIIPGTSTVENIKLPQTPSGPRTLVTRIYPPSTPFPPQSSKQSNDNKVFDLTPPSGRQTLTISGLLPQNYSANQLEDMGIDFKVLSQVNLRTAPFYAFATRSRSLGRPDSSSSLVFGRTAVLDELHAKGCALATQAWIDNHWSLILWKLAGMVVLDPASEGDPSMKRWCWPEVIRQFMYRYERDLNGSSRPPLRLITTRDASAESPMVLCVSDIIWPTSEEDTPQTQTCPELEVTDGWYRLRARIDAPIARGISKGKIKIGRKIAVAGARLSTERKEGSEILEAYNSNVLVLTGNSTHMAPWHAKLGFQRGAFIATLNSLTSDGGKVAVMMFTVIKAHPIAYIEFSEDTDGRRRTEGPYDAKEELRLSTQWKAKRESHASELWSEYEKRKDRLLDHAEYLERRAGSKFISWCGDGPSDKIYDLYDTLREDPDAAKNIILSSLSREDAGWLALHIHEKLVQERDDVSKEIEQELESICPPRDVKSFCVVVVNDTQTYKHPANRTAQVTVWDVPGVSGSEGYGRNPFAPGQRYIVTNLIPSQPSAWMDRTSGGEVYLSTRKNSKWTLIN